MNPSNEENWMAMEVGDYMTISNYCGAYRVPGGWMFCAGAADTQSCAFIPFQIDPILVRAEVVK